MEGGYSYAEVPPYLFVMSKPEVVVIRTTSLRGYQEETLKGAGLISYLQVVYKQISCSSAQCSSAVKEKVWGVIARVCRELSELIYCFNVPVCSGNITYN